MGDLLVERQSETPYRPLVAFDFDGTLTCRDSFTAFLAWREGARRYVAGLARIAPALAGYVLNRDRGRLKIACVRQFLGGATLEEVQAQAQAFAIEKAQALFRPDAIRTWRRWQGEGARLLIVTASPEFVVAPFARGLGAELLIGTRLATDADGRLTGELDGANCRGPEKVRRLRAEYGEDVWLAAAYGDSDGDTEMLSIAEAPGMKVFTGAGG
jgi:phosphatidylglycerophosphatase C